MPAGLHTTSELHRTGVKRFHHPLFGGPTLSYEALELPADPDSPSWRTRRNPTRHHRRSQPLAS